MASAKWVSSRTRAVSSDRCSPHGLGCYPSKLWSGSRTRAFSSSSSAVQIRRRGRARVDDAASAALVVVSATRSRDIGPPDAKHDIAHLLAAVDGEVLKSVAGDLGRLARDRPVGRPTSPPRRTCFR